MLIGDVGQNNIEEVDVGASGKNYGWNKKEGSFLFDPATGSVAPDQLPTRLDRSARGVQPYRWECGHWRFCLPRRIAFSIVW